MPINIICASRAVPARQVAHRNCSNAWWNQPQVAHEVERTRPSVKDRSSGFHFSFKWLTRNETVQANQPVSRSFKHPSSSHSRPFSTAKPDEYLHLYNTVKPSGSVHASTSPSDKIVAQLVNKQRFKELAATNCPKRNLEIISEILKEEDYPQLPITKGPTT